MENTEVQTNRVYIAAKIKPVISQAVQNLAEADNRSVSQMIEVLLSENPKVEAEILRIESASVATV